MRSSPWTLPCLGVLVGLSLLASACAPRNPAVGTAFPGAASAAAWDVRHDWPQFRGPARDGVTPLAEWRTRWDAPPARLWEKDLGRGASSFAVSGGRLFTMANQNRRDIVYCLNPLTGAEIWRFVYRCELSKRQFEGGPASTPTVAGGRVYTLSHEGQLFCLDAETGAQVWAVHVVGDLGGVRPFWGYAGSLLVADGKVVADIGGTKGSAVALDAATGAVVWQEGSGPAGYSSPVLFDRGGQAAVAIFRGDGLVAHALSDGAELWRWPWETSYSVNAAMPILAGGRAFVSSGYGRGCALLDVSGAEPSLVWESRVLRTHFGSCILRDGNLYGIDDSGELRSVDLSSGEKRWGKRGFGKGTLILGGGTLLVLSEKGEIVTVEAAADGYRELSRAEVLEDRCWVAPALVGGLVFARNNVGRVVCIDLRPGEPGGEPSPPGSPGS